MSASWKKLAARIDALNLRERLFLFLAVIVVCVALADSLWIGPAQLQHQQVRQRFEANDAELRQLQGDLRLQAQQPDPARQAREELARVQVLIETTDKSISALSGASSSGTSLPNVLVHFLRRHNSLTLVRTASLQVQPTPLGGTPATASTGTTPAARPGQELTIAGPYADLVRYVQTLEAAMPDLRWGPVILKADQQPPELTLQVYLAGSQP